jgi:hypothetical protein
VECFLFLPLEAWGGDINTPANIKTADQFHQTQFVFSKLIAKIVAKAVVK